MIDKILNYITMYSPTILCVFMTIFNLARTLKSFKRVDNSLLKVNVDPPIKTLETKLEAKYDSIKQSLDNQNIINLQLQEQLLQAQLEAKEANAKCEALHEQLIAEFKEHRELLNKVIRNDVEIKADFRRIENDETGSIKDI